MRTIRPRQSTNVSRKYAELIAEFPLRPIRSERQLKQACDVAGRLALQRRLSRDAQDYLDVLSHIIEAYEDEHHAIDDSEVSARDMLAFLIENHNLTLKQLAHETGLAVSAVSALLRGDRDFTLEHVRRFSRRFAVDPRLFIEYEPATKLLAE